MLFFLAKTMKRPYFLALFMFLFFLPSCSLFSSNRASSYPQSSELLNQLAKKVINELEKKASFRYEPIDKNVQGRREYKEVEWNGRQPVAVYFFSERDTKKIHPFIETFEKQLSLCMDDSKKFMALPRDMQKMEEMKIKEAHILIDETTATSIGNLLGARYFLTGTYWKEGNETIIFAELWDGERGLAIRSQTMITGWELALVKKKIFKDWWKGVILVAFISAITGLIMLLNSSVLYELKTNKNNIVFILIQVCFIMAVLGVAYYFGVWWLFTA
ncbi:MAG: hypothetical protein HQK76_19195 [Desulfobacterales bacterium]|nr:hypothetical protein [Desulfobacterales bacterium]